MKFIKKPVVVEAQQWTVNHPHPKVVQGWKAETGQVITVEGVTGYDKQVWVIETLEGWHEVTNGDWIIQGVRGEFYPCKHEIFVETYNVLDN